MIRNFSDHAANERTFLAWVRTAIAVMAFGFVVEQFNRNVRIAGAGFGGVAGLALMAAGLAMVAVATLRFVATSRWIDDQGEHAGPGARFDLALAVLLFLLGCALVAYMALNVAGSP